MMTDKQFIEMIQRLATEEFEKADSSDKSTETTRAICKLANKIEYLCKAHLEQED